MFLPLAPQLLSVNAGETRCRGAGDTPIPRVIPMLLIAGTDAVTAIVTKVKYPLALFSRPSSCAATTPWRLARHAVK